MTETIIYEDKKGFFNLVTEILYKKICVMGVEDGNDNLINIGILEKPA